MIKVIKDLTGKKFNRLTVICQADDGVQSNGRRYTKWHCKCDCGNELDVAGGNLTSGNTKSCGCLQKENTAKATIERCTKYNKYEFYDDYGICYTEDMKYSWKFDLEDYDKLKNVYWHEIKRNEKDYYAMSRDKISRKTIYMAREIMGVKDKNIIVDHINHDTSDNRKCNLRVCTRTQNHMNVSNMPTNTSGTIGVHFGKKENKWQARITVYGKTINLGFYTNIEDAIKARKEAEEKYFGEYSYDNSMKKGELY